MHYLHNKTSENHLSNSAVRLMQLLLLPQFMQLVSHLGLENAKVYGKLDVHTHILTLIRVETQQKAV